MKEFSACVMSHIFYCKDKKKCKGTGSNDTHTDRGETIKMTDYTVVEKQIKYLFIFCHLYRFFELFVSTLSAHYINPLRAILRNFYSRNWAKYHIIFSIKQQ